MGSENSNEKAREIRAHLRAEEREDGETDRSERGKDQRRDERPAISIETYRNRTVRGGFGAESGWIHGKGGDKVRSLSL